MRPLPAMFLLAFLAPAAAAQGGRPTPEQLVEQARSFLPSYDGDHRAFLTADERRDVLAAAGILEAALALQPELVFALWYRGHAEVLLGEDARNRGRAGEAQERYGAAFEAFDRAIELEADHHWAFYARGVASLQLGEPWRGIADLDEAVRLTNEKLEAAGAGEDGDVRFVRFKARWWRADARMRVLEFDRAREEFRSFYADNGNNLWDLGYSLAQSHLRQRDFAGARRELEGILANEEFATFDRTYLELGSLAGLLGDRDEAVRRLTEAIERERVPTLYARLWLWILAEGERREEARADLAGLLEHPPPDLSDWDVRLGRFLLGEGTVEEFLADAGAEEERRKSEGMALDDLGCEVAFYAGLRLEREAGELAAEPERRARLAAALWHYWDALSFRPTSFKWEWAFARRRLAALTADLGEFPLPDLSFWFALAAGGPIERAFLHRAGEEASTQGPPFEASELRHGDLLQAVVRAEDGSRSVVVRVVGTVFPGEPR